MNNNSNFLYFAKKCDEAAVPTKKFETDAGWDLYYCGKDIIIPPFTLAILETGIRIVLPQETFGLIKPKSKSNYLIGGGVIDNGYTGELLVKVFNISEWSIAIGNGIAIAQLIILKMPYYLPRLTDEEYIDENFNTDRGNSGGIVKQIK